MLLKIICKKRMTIFALTAIMLLMPISVYAEESEAEIDYGDEFEAIMDLIIEGYLYDEVTKEQLFEAAMEGMFNELDQYSVFMTPTKGDSFENSLNPSFVGIGVQLEQRGSDHVVVNVYDETPASRGGVQVGDIIRSVDGVTVSGYSLSELVEFLLGEEGTDVTITFDRNGKEYTAILTRASFLIPTVYYKGIQEIYENINIENASQIGYIDLSVFSVYADEEFAEYVEQAKQDGVKYLILDLRNNSGGYVDTAIQISNEIVPKGDIVRFTDHLGNVNVFQSNLEEPPFEIVTLVNESSASASEILAAAIQDSEVGVLVGEKTFGKGVSQYVMPLSNGYSMILTMQEFFSRNNNKINGVGVTPNYIVEIPNFIYSDARFYLNDARTEVENLEKVLKYLGYDVNTPDTIYDEKSFQAVKQFQEDFGLYPYGVCDFTTQEKLNEALQNSVWEKDIQLEKAVNIILDQIENE